MQNNTGNEHPEDGLVANIRQALQDHEMPYREGAWEDFDRRDRRKRPVFWLWPIGSAAAILVLALFFWPQSPDHPEKIQQISRSLPRNDKEDSDKSGSDLDTPPSPVIPMRTRHLEHAPQMTKGERTAMQQPIPNDSTITALFVQVPVEEGTLSRHPADLLYQQSDTLQVRQELSWAERLANAVPIPLKAPENYKRWNFGVLVSPVTGKGLNTTVGYGASIAYRANRMVTLTSGLSLQTFELSKNFPIRSAYPISGDARDLQSVTAKYRGIDVPVELRLRPVERVYLTAGLSAFLAFDRNQSNDYQYTTASTMEVKSPSGDFALVNTYELSNSSSTLPRTALPNEQLIGFYNVSAGYVYPVGLRHSLSLEPYLKLPMRRLTTEELRILVMGVRLKFDF